MSMLVDYLWFVGGYVVRIICDLITIILSPFLYFYHEYHCHQFIRTKSFKTIFITGSTSGIGRAVAIEFLKRDPAITLILTGTNQYRLDSTLKELKTLSSKDTTIESKLIDVCNKDEMKQYIIKMDNLYTIDLVIANAGVSPSMLSNPHYMESTYKVLDINCRGVLNTVMPIVARMQDRKGGHIAVNGSVAGYIPYSFFGSHYSASKAYVRYLSNDLRAKLKLIGNIDVSYIAPGFVRSRMVEEEKYKNMIGFMTEDKAARIIVDGLKSNKSVIAFPTRVAILAWLIGTMHPIVNVLVDSKFTKRLKIARYVGFYHEFDPNDEFGGEC